MNKIHVVISVNGIIIFDHTFDFTNYAMNTVFVQRILLSEHVAILHYDDINIKIERV